MRRSADDPLSTVGLALLAYGLVQLLSKFIDKIGFGRAGGDQRASGGPGSFSEEDKKRLERTCEIVAAGDQRLQRIAETAATQQKLVGQALDELRESGRKQEQLARKLNAVWNRIGSRNEDSR
jgi:chromosome segregation ATPase